MTYADAKMEAFSETDFRIGKVISKALEIFSQNILTFTLIAGAVALPSILVSLSGPDATQQGQVIQSLIVFALVIFLSPVATAVILHASFQHMRGRPVRLSESVSGGLSRFLPLLGVMILATLGLTLGLMLLIVPGIILMTMWYVAVPACVVEKTGPIRSLGRSRELTKGFRWKVFALIVVVYILTMLGSALLMLIANALGGLWGQVAVSVIWQGLSGGFGAVLIAVAYYYLRVAKEGIDVEQIAAVFD